ncbi:MAG: FxsA family protein [Candidatus Bipolaricaulia bacterium]
MLFRLFLLFIIVPIVELVVLLQLGRYIGVWPTLTLVILTGILGAMLTRIAGLSVLVRLRDRLSADEMPTEELFDGAIILVSGALLITPGLLTDLVGFAGLIPTSRSWIKRLLRRRVKRVLERRAKITVDFEPKDNGNWR